MERQHRLMWELAKPYLNTRKNDKHTLYCYAFAQRLVALKPEADAAVVLPAILLHDVGWSTVPEEKQLQSFGPHMIYPELRRQHETEGVRIAREILEETGWDVTKCEEIVTIIDGHDTRLESRSLNDSLVRDADKLWRYTPFGLETLGEWFDYGLDEQLALLDKWLEHRFHTKIGRHMAEGLLVGLRLEMKRGVDVWL